MTREEREARAYSEKLGRFVTLAFALALSIAMISIGVHLGSRQNSHPTTISAPSDRR